MGFVIYAINTFFDVLRIIILAYIILSWFARDPYSRLYRIYCTLGMVSEPILTPFRRLMGRFSGGNLGIDLSPILALLALSFLQDLVRRILINAFY